MKKNQTFNGDQIEEESSWRYPLGIFFVTLVLCSIFLYHYVGPDVDVIQGETPRSTVSAEVITLEVGDRTFYIPANHTVYPKDRRDGRRESLSLYALWPTMNGYAPARREEFITDKQNGRRVDIVIKKRGSLFTEQQRLELLYLPHAVDKRGFPFDYGLAKFVFKEGRGNAPTNGYSNKELFVGETDMGEVAVLFCYLPQVNNIVSQECWREYDLSADLTVKYFFKRPYLAEWKAIDATLRDFVETLTVGE